MQLHRLTLKRACNDPLAQALEAMYLGLHQSSAVVAAPLLPYGVPQPVMGFVKEVQRRQSRRFAALVARCCGHCG